MPSRPRFVVVPSLELNELEAYHEDIVSSLRLYFSPSAPTYASRFVGKRPDEVASILSSRIDESDLRSAFAILTGLEARFRVDFNYRCEKRFKDDLSVYFRAVEKARSDKVRLDEDILEGWRLHTSAPASLIGELRGAFRFRHWLAHGRYWTPKLGRKYNFDYVHLTASSIISGFPFKS
jgi:hypothetical protein